MNEARQLLLALVPLITLAACQSGFHSSSRPVSIVSGLSVEEFLLSCQSPTNKKHGIRLVSIAPSRRVTIELLDSHRRYSTTPGHAFVSEEFGRSGLVLESASPSQQSAALSRSICTTTLVR